jgi:2,3-bisphosphoglycerate-dependent phosphoglycerate mutase
MTTHAKLVIFRHGETPYNKKTLMTGQAEVPLTRRGRQQAEEAGALIATIKFDKVYSSNLSRAFNTAALALKASKTHAHLRNTDGTWQIEQRVEIAEMHTGKFTGRNHKTDPEIINWKRIYDVPLPGGGESDAQVVERVQKFFDSEIMPRLLRGENVLIVAHSGTLHAFAIVLGVEEAPASGMPMITKKVPNATPTVYDYEDGIIKTVSPLKNPKAPVNQNATPKKRWHGPKI